MFKIDTDTNDYMTIVVTHECDRKCPYCIDAYLGNDEYISLDTVDKALSVAKSYNLKDILLVGGEPTAHPDILEIARRVKEYGFNLILTTNYSRPEITQELDEYVDSFNISYYKQKQLPDQKKFTADLTLSALIHAKQLKNKEQLDTFIDKYSDKFHLKFSTLVNNNNWTNRYKDVGYLNALDETMTTLFNEIGGQIYRGHIIKRYDIIINTNAPQSLKCHVDGEISQSWERTFPMQNNSHKTTIPIYEIC